MSYFRLMAYKDEYEVARLMTDPGFEAKLRRQFGGDFRLRYHLAPPLLARRDPETGERMKRAYGPRMKGAFRLLARMKRLRGTVLDPFGYSAERRAERWLVAKYEGVIGELLATLADENHALAVQIARVPEAIRGFGHVKARNIAAAKEAEAVLLVRFRGEYAQPVAAE
jgi:indolepyruvate ferredoxin oxidoreductase